MGNDCFRCEKGKTYRSKDKLYGHNSPDYLSERLHYHHLLKYASSQQAYFDPKFFSLNLIFSLQNRLLIIRLVLYLAFLPRLAVYLGHEAAGQNYDSTFPCTHYLYFVI